MHIFVINTKRFQAIVQTMIQNTDNKFYSSVSNFSFVPYTYRINANPKNKILMSENIGQVNYFFDNSVQLLLDFNCFYRFI